MSSNTKPPRNSFVKAMVLRNKNQVFKHRTEEQGGSRNESLNLLEEAELESSDRDDDQDDRY